MNIIPTYINLVWNSKKNWKVTYSYEKILPPECYITRVKLRKSKSEINVYGQIKDNYKNIIKSNNISQIINNKSVLKSNIQKCVRRNLSHQAVISALNLINLDFLTFIRRLIIITIEDVGITDNLPLLVWLMMAYPNFDLNNEIIQYLLLTVYTLCRYSNKINPDSDNSNLDWDNLDINNDYIVSLLIRSEYGGMKGDIRLINKFINSNNVFRNIIKVSTKNMVIIRNICKYDIVKPSIDFHCYPKMLEYISNNINYIYDVETIKKTIWFNSSCYNYRESSDVRNFFKKEWIKIKPYVIKYQNTKFSKLFLIKKK
jgi:hypothetical protein